MVGTIYSVLYQEDPQLHSSLNRKHFSNVCLFDCVDDIKRGSFFQNKSIFHKALKDGIFVSLLMMSTNQWGERVRVLSAIS